jgi:capsular exopolysaccharide synthesis family protein
MILVGTELIASNGALSVFTQIISESPQVANAYVELLGALRLSRSLRTGNSILVTSTEPGEGKTTVASCLAITASSAGQAALLIDGDLRKSSLASAIGIAETTGLTDVILGQAEAAEAIHTLGSLPYSPKAGLVSVMAGGTKSSQCLSTVDWSRARATAKSIWQAFGIVLLDSPPILAANDALLLASVVDGVLLVVGAGSANLDELRQVKEQLNLINTPLVGIVLNKFDPKIHGRSNKPYRGYNGLGR